VSNARFNGPICRMDVKFEESIMLIWRAIWGSCCLLQRQKGKPLAKSGWKRAGRSIFLGPPPQAMLLIASTALQTRLSGLPISFIITFPTQSTNKRPQRRFPMRKIDLSNRQRKSFPAFAVRFQLSSPRSMLPNVFPAQHWQLLAILFQKSDLSVRRVTCQLQSQIRYQKIRPWARKNVFNSGYCQSVFARRHLLLPLTVKAEPNRNEAFRFLSLFAFIIVASACYATPTCRASSAVLQHKIDSGSWLVSRMTCTSWKHTKKCVECLVPQHLSDSCEYPCATARSYQREPKSKAERNRPDP